MHTKVGRLDVLTDDRLIDTPPSLSNCFDRGLDSVSFYKVCTSKLLFGKLLLTVIGFHIPTCWRVAVLQMHENSQLLIKTTRRLTGPSLVRAADAFWSPVGWIYVSLAEHCRVIILYTCTPAAGAGC